MDHNDTPPARPSETVLWQGRPSQWQNFGWFLACLLILPIPIAIWKWLVTWNVQISLSSVRLRVKSGVFSKQTEDVELYRIKDWSLREPLIQRIFGKGTVQVLSSDRSAPDLGLKWISRPDQFVEMLRNAVEAVRDSKRVRELDMGFASGSDIEMDTE